MMRKPRLLLDVDGILADFVSATVKIMNSMTGMSLIPDDIINWEVTSILEDHQTRELCKAEFNKAGFCSTLEVYDGAQEAVKILQDKTELFFVTSPMLSNPTWMPDRVEWLERHFGIDHKHVVFANKKYIISGDFMVDDSPKNINDWLFYNPDSCGLLWDRPYNRTPDADKLIRVSKWDEIIQMINECKM